MTGKVKMFNNRNRVIDVLSVAEKSVFDCETGELMLHPDTSYIALVLDSVNGTHFKHQSLFCCKIWQLLAYGLSVAALSLVELVFMKEMMGRYPFKWYSADAFGMSAMILPAVLIGILIGLLVLRHYHVKGIRWTI